ncbi:MAG: DNA/RNA non-specific endonuclease, partial [Lachnospiraceae bacterium]|nr:DNA/RNA non-specific endonuclease [Lachnospiraceae bacterium]
GEHYSELDELGRCGKAYAMLEKSLMPTEERQSIGQVKPTGWRQNKYPGIVKSEPPYLYNRCHLLAFSLTGENANEKNLITGTRCFNFEGMMPYEVQLISCVEDLGYHVLYRVTPYFKDKELVARGVEMEALSIEDGGKEICMHVFIYNVQPGIRIDYLTGENEEE